MQSKKIIFMGTSEFAVPILKALIESNHIVKAVFSQSLKPKGRNLKIHLSPVHTLANQYSIPIITDSKLNTTVIFSKITNIDADVILVAAYGIIIPQKIIKSKQYCINIHPSMLPKYRGSSPIQNTILNGDKETAVSIINMTTDVDAGDILIQEKYQVKEGVDTTELTYTLGRLSAKLILILLLNIDSISPQKQSTKGISYTQKITKADGLLDFNNSAIVLERKIRAFASWPKTYFIHQCERIFILQAKIQAFGKNIVLLKPGTVIQCSDVLMITCSDAILVCTILQRAGKRMMNAKNFLRGYSINKGASLINKNLTS